MTTCSDSNVAVAGCSGQTTEPSQRRSPGWAAFLSSASIEVLPEQAATFAPSPTAFAHGSYVFLPHIAGHSLDLRVAAAKNLIARGLRPVVHLSARNFHTVAEFDGHLRDLDRAGVKCCLAIGGVPSVTPKAVISTASEMIQSHAFQSASFDTVFIAGHPEGLSGVDDAVVRTALINKLSLLRMQGRRAEIVTQFAFDGAAMARWARDLRSAGIDAPIRFGVAGVTSLPKLIKFAVMCGVGPSLGILKRQAGSVFKVMRDQDPGEVIEALHDGLEQSSRAGVHVHFFPFGGWEKTASWIVSKKA